MYLYRRDTGVYPKIQREPAFKGRLEAGILKVIDMRVTLFHFILSASLSAKFLLS